MVKYDDVTVQLTGENGNASGACESCRRQPTSQATPRGDPQPDTPVAGVSGASPGRSWVKKGSLP